MKIIIEANNELECYSLYDEDSDQSHDGEKDIEWIANVFEIDNAVLIASFLNNKEKFINNEAIKKSCLEIVKKLPNLKKIKFKVFDSEKNKYLDSLNWNINGMGDLFCRGLYENDENGISEGIKIGNRFIIEFDNK